MGDPVGLVIHGVGLLLDQLIKEAKDAAQCHKYCDALAGILKEFKPLVDNVENMRQSGAGWSEGIPDGSVTKLWLEGLRTLLTEAQQVVQECRDLNTAALFAKWRISRKIVSVTKRLSDAAQRAPVANLELQLQIRKELDERFLDLAMDMKRAELGITTYQLLQKESIDKNFAVSEIKRSTENLTVAATSGFDAITVHDEGNVYSPSTLSNVQQVPDFIVGMDEHVAQLRAFLLSDDKFKTWVGVWGKGGIGKTLLAAQLYNSAEVQRHFAQKLWVTVGRSPSIRRLYSRLCDMLALIVPYGADSDVKTTLYNRLQNEQVLLVLDDVWEDDGVEVLDLLNVTSGSSSGSKTLVTTRNLQVLEKKGAAYVTLDRLSDADSWKVFCHVSFGGVHKLPPSETLQALVKKVADECKGLPLALKVTAACLARQTNLEPWKLALQKLEESKALGKAYEEQVFKRLQLSYESLKDLDDRLPTCFKYFAAFPEDEAVDVDYLLDLWAGDEFINADTVSQDFFIEGPYLLGTLIGRSLIDLQDHSWSHKRRLKALKCQIHDVLRDLALYLLHHDIPDSRAEALFKAGKRLEAFPEQWRTEGAGCQPFFGQKKQLLASRLSLVENSLKALPRKVRAPRLEVLLLSGNKFTSLPSGFVKEFSKLKVLDLSHTLIETLPSSVGTLSYLRHLNLSFTNLQYLPSSIGQLKSLEYLSLQNVRDVQPWPFQISKLQSLRSLNTRGCLYIWTTPESLGCGAIGRLGASTDNVESLQNLQQLRHLWIQSSDWTTLHFKLTSFKKLQWVGLQYYKLVLLPDESGENFDAELEVLDLSNCLSLQKLPSWLPSAKQLRTLDLRLCGKLQDLPDLHLLPELAKLDLSGCRSLRKLPAGFTSAGAFPSLQELMMQLCVKLDEFPEVMEGALPALTDLVLTGCTSLKSVPSSLGRLPNLCHLDLSRCTQIKSLDDWDNSDSHELYFNKVEELKLHDVPLDRLPKCLGTLPALKRLDIRRCPVGVSHELAALQSQQKLTILA